MGVTPGELKSQQTKSRVSVINVSPLILLCSACDTGAGPCQHFSFAGWRTVRLHQQRAPEGPRKAECQKDTSLPGSALRPVFFSARA